MRIFASKSYIFQSGEEEAFIRNQEIKDIPDWIADTILFKLAKEEGSISIIESPEQQKEIENGGTSKGKGKNNNSDEQPPADKE